MAAIPVWVGYVLAAIAVAASFIANRNARKAMERAKKKAAAEEDARKGFDVVVEAESKPLPIVFGRNRLGGVRVYHQVNSIYNPPPATDSNKTKSFDASQDIKFVTSYRERIISPTDGSTTYVTRFNYTMGGIFESAMTYRKRPALEYLFFQQVIGSSKLNSIIDITVDNMDYNSPNLMTQPTPLEY